MPSSPSSKSLKPLTTPADGARRPAWVIWTVVALRIAVGALFIASGFAKCVDPWGTIYKIGEYFTVWDMAFPHSVTVSAAVTLGCAELLLGVMMLLGCYRRTCVWALLCMMAVMLPLTLYIYVRNPVADCGCFGDMWHISNLATFLKNVGITAALIFLAIYNRSVRCAVSPYIQWLPASITLCYALLLALIGYQEQPMLDFRSFPTGTSLLASDEGGTAALPTFEFIYEKDGERRSFGIDQLPDSSWTFVERHAITGQPGAAADGFYIYDGDGNEVNDEAIAESGPEVMVTIPKLAQAGISNTYYLNELYTLLSSHDVPMIAVIAGSDDDIEVWRDLSMAQYPIYTADPLQIKELARGPMAIVTLQDGCVHEKYNASSLLTDMFTDDNPPDIAFLTEDPDDGSDIAKMSTAYGILMAIIIALNNGILALWHAYVARRRAKRAKRAESAKETPDNQQPTA